MFEIPLYPTEIEPSAGAVVNVASVPQRSPFRYPGGKTWLVPRIREWLGSLPARPLTFVEPFAGGAIVGLTVAIERLASHVILVERDEQVAAVWRTILQSNDGAAWLAERICSFNLTADSVAKLLDSSPRLVRERAFRTIVQNRTSHGGILAPGAGAIKNGENGKGLRSRWYPQTLSQRILAIAQVRERVSFVEGDGLDAIRRYARDQNAAFFVDPPYTASAKKAGSRLYTYHQLDHERLFSLMESVTGDFLMTYDDAEEVRALALCHRFDRRLIPMTNTHHATMFELIIGRELSWVDRATTRQVPQFEAMELALA
jgi:DNA adenine methylase